MKKEKLKKYKNIGIKVYPLLLLVIFLTVITGCGKNNFNENLFTKTMEKNNFIVAELPNDNNIQYLAVSVHYQISLYKFTDKKGMNKSYNKQRKKYNKKTKDKKNYFYIESENVYTLFYKVDKYYIEVEVPKTYKKDVIRILKEMNLKI